MDYPRRCTLAKLSARSAAATFNSTVCHRDPSKAIDHGEIVDGGRRPMWVGDLITDGQGTVYMAVASASSQSSDTTPASAVIATDATEFHEGTFIRSVWAPNREDESPWLEIAFEIPKPVSQIQIQEGRYGADSTIEAFTISLRVNGKWEMVYAGTGIGNTFGLVLDETHLADAMRIDFERWQRKININMVNAY